MMLSELVLFRLLMVTDSRLNVQDEDTPLSPVAPSSCLHVATPWYTASNGGLNWTSSLFLPYPTTDRLIGEGSNQGRILHYLPAPSGSHPSIQLNLWCGRFPCVRARRMTDAMASVVEQFRQKACCEPENQRLWSAN
ncbi:uncharacterized protein LOC132405391 isoform X2 [Hypanus sabinus]|uniref:uncharacterized protein LOC132405391 isoform X2 n=1 Tax=Hypanus sabinus TaxID=79690 RepID=UPI0028C4A400|nr:uncharacterized protein LOC132405391 isoform X2 [Hypanus sabinus]